MDGDVTVSWRAPGRVNLIGEHTDYNDGFALPFALALGCTASAARIADPMLRIRSAQRDEPVDIPLADLRPGAHGWAGYPAGVLWALGARGLVDPGAGVRLDLDSDVPTGSGLSSSAALVCAVTTALDDLFGLHLADADLLAVSRSAENDYVGAPTGGMDQLASLRCTDSHALFCDMRTLAVEQVPFDVAAGGRTVLVVDSRTAHSHADGEYRKRREGCERAARELGVDALRDVAIEELDAALARLSDDELRRYVRHVVTEDDRVQRTVQLLRAGRVGDIGGLLVASHASMRDDYRITTPELDLIVDALLEAGALGARMTGGGFGGCAIAVIDSDRRDAAVEQVERACAGRGFPRPGVISARPHRGAHPVT